MNTQETKICRVCNLPKNLVDYTPNLKCNLGVVATCKLCSKKPKPIKIPPKEGYLFCNVCKVELLKEEFSRDISTKSGLCYSCKSCAKIRMHEYSKKDKLTPTYKKCNICEKIKMEEEFHKKRNSKDGLSPNCNICTKPIIKKYYSENKKRLNLNIKNHKLTHKKRYNKMRNDRVQERRDNDPVFRLRRNASSLIKMQVNSYIASGKLNKSTVSEKLLGCNIAQFIKHIESQMLSWMSWDNRGKYNGLYNSGWDLDHIVPSSAMKTEEEVLLLHHWSNYQPLCSKVNRFEKKDIIYPVTNLILKLTW
jgi:hypothetical protein